MEFLRQTTTRALHDNAQIYSGVNDTAHEMTQIS